MPLLVVLFFFAAVVVVVVESPQAPKDDPEKRLRTRWETGKFIDGLPKVQSVAVRVEGGATEPQVVVCLISIIANPARSSPDRLIRCCQRRSAG